MGAEAVIVEPEPCRDPSLEVSFSLSSAPERFESSISDEAPLRPGSGGEVDCDVQLLGRDDSNEVEEEDASGDCRDVGLVTLGGPDGGSEELLELDVGDADCAMPVCRGS